MSVPLRLEVITPYKQLLSEDVDYVSLPGFEGEFGVLPGHIPYVSALRVGVLSYVKGAVRERVFISGGFAEVMDNRVTVLADSGECCADIDIARAECARERATQRLHQERAREKINMTRAQAALQRANMRISMRR